VDPEVAAVVEVEVEVAAAVEAAEVECRVPLLLPVEHRP
jgi:hypothetical protein